MNNYDDPQQIINVGSGTEVSIRELAETIADVVGYKGLIMWDTEKPNGTMRKVMDVSRIKSTGWEPKIPYEKTISDLLNFWRDQVEKNGGNYLTR